MRRRLKVVYKNIKHPARLLNLFRLRRARNKMPDNVSYSPSVVDIEPNVTCNLSCEMCQVTTWNRSVPDLDPEDFSLFLDKIPALTRIKLQGMGEPFLNKGVFDLISYADGKDIFVQTTSNGTMLDEKLCRRIVNSGLDQISISVDGASAETYGKIRGKGNFERVIGNIERLVSTRGKSKTPKITIRMVGMKENIHELPAMVELCDSLKVDEFTLQHDLCFWGKEEWLQKLAGKVLSDDETIERYIEEAGASAGGLGLDFHCHRSDRYGVAEGIICPWPWESIYITSDGYICPCCIVPDPRVVNFGNLHELNFNDIWNGDEYRRFRGRHRSGDIPDFCKGCYNDYLG